MVAVAAVLAGLRVVSAVEVAPVVDGQPPTTSLVWDPPLLLLTLLLVTVAAVVAVVAVARWRRETPRR
nr:hypothetical protein [Mycolicibacterium palauense]